MLKALLRGVVVVSVLGVTGWDCVAADVEPGPERGGLRLRLVVTKRSTPREGGFPADGFTVRLDVINVSPETVTLRTGWESTEEGDVKEYLKLHANIETYPQLEPARGAYGLREARTMPQKELALAAGETLSLQWQTAGRRLKNKSELFAQNPDFTEPGLYAVHVTLDVITATGTHRLRSNEQLVQIGGSPKQLRHTYGHLTRARSDKTGELSLGAFEQVSAGDRFNITSKTGSWRLTVIKVNSRSSDVKIERLGEEGPELPEVGAGAVFAPAESRGP